MTWKEKLKRLTSKWHPERNELSEVAMTGDYDDLINKPEGGGGGSFTPYIIKISESILNEKISSLGEEFSDSLNDISKEVEFSDADEGLMEMIFVLLRDFNIDLLNLTINKLNFFTQQGINRYYPYKIEIENDYVKIYFYDLPLGNIYLDSIPSLLNDDTSLEIVDGVYEYQYPEPNPSEPNPGSQQTT